MDAGFVNENLADLATKNKVQLLRVNALQNCPDKSARLHYELRLWRADQLYIKFDTLSVAALELPDEREEQKQKITKNVTASGGADSEEEKKPQKQTTTQNKKKQTLQEQIRAAVAQNQDYATPDTVSNVGSAVTAAVTAASATEFSEKINITTNSYSLEDNLSLIKTIRELESQNENLGKQLSLSQQEIANWKAKHDLASKEIEDLKAIQMSDSMRGTNLQRTTAMMAQGIYSRQQQGNDKKEVQQANSMSFAARFAENQSPLSQSMPEQQQQQQQQQSFKELEHKIIYLEEKVQQCEKQITLYKNLVKQLEKEKGVSLSDSESVVSDTENEATKSSSNLDKTSMRNKDNLQNKSDNGVITPVRIDRNLQKKGSILLLTEQLHKVKQHTAQEKDEKQLAYKVKQQRLEIEKLNYQIKELGILNNQSKKQQELYLKHEKQQKDAEIEAQRIKIRELDKSLRETLIQRDDERIAKEHIKLQMNNMERQYQQSLRSIEYLEEQLYDLKRDMANILNLIFDKGDGDLLDEIESQVLRQRKTNPLSLID